MGQAMQGIVIGASAGALDALTRVLSPLPKNYPFPIMVVVHIPPDKNSVLAEVLQVKCAMTLQEAEDKEPLLPGHIYIAPPDYHLLVEKDFRLSLSSDEPVLYSRPSIDVLFETAADAYEDKLTGVILTGANNDGAAGIEAIAARGGSAVVQNPETAFAPAMPEAALQAVPDALCLSLEEISSHLARMGAP